MDVGIQAIRISFSDLVCEAKLGCVFYPIGFGIPEPCWKNLQTPHC